MSRVLRIVLAAGGLLAMPAAAARLHRPAPADAIRWIAPAPGDRLVAGEPVRLAWEPGARFGELAEAEEWELFLSYDGGASWPVRLTPHLDVAVREFTVALPALASENVRLLLRIGDERIEHEVELEGRWRIGPAALSPAAAFSRVPPSAPPGEAARPGLPGVRLRVEGPRHGRGATWIVAGSGRPPSFVPVHVRESAPKARPARHERPRTAPPAEARRSADHLRSPSSSPRTRTESARCSAVSPLDQTCRRNE